LAALDIFKASGLEKKITPSEPTPEKSKVQEALEGAVLEDTTRLTREQLQEALPAQMKIKISDELVDRLNNVANDPAVAEQVRNNFIGYTHVLKDGKFKLEQYLEACAYVTYKLMGYTNKDAYALTFPERVRSMRAENKDDKHISAFVAAYNQNKLVNLILEQSLIPVHVLNQDIFQEAIARQAYLMKHATSEKVQCEAANSLLNALKPPEKSKFEVKVDIEDNSGIKELREALRDVATYQANQIKNGVSTKNIAHAELFDKDGKSVG
jgi:transcriptional regulator of met regulon